MNKQQHSLSHFGPDEFHNNTHKKKICDGNWMMKAKHMTVIGLYTHYSKQRKKNLQCNRFENLRWFGTFNQILKHWLSFPLIISISLVHRAVQFSSNTHTFIVVYHRFNKLMIYRPKSLDAYGIATKIRSLIEP